MALVKDSGSYYFPLIVPFLIVIVYTRALCPVIVLGSCDVISDVDDDDDDPDGDCGFYPDGIM